MDTNIISNRALLVSKIRFAAEPDNPSLLDLWLDEPLPGTLTSVPAQRRYYLLQYQLLLATLRDEYIPLLWRRTCLDFIHKPLQRLSSLAQTQTEKREVQRLRFEATMLGRCCVGGHTLH